MKNPESDHCIFLVESENENENEEEYKDCDGDGDGDGNEGNKDFEEKDSESLKYADEDPHSLTKPDSMDTSWPQSYMQSMDLIASQSVNFLGSPSLSPLSGSFLSSSPKKRHSPKTNTCLDTPLLSSEADNQQLKKHHSSDHSLQTQWTSSTKKLSHQNSVKIRKSSFSQAVINGVNLLCGVGLLSTPYAVKQRGWVGLSIFCVISIYTGLLLRCCLDSQPGLNTYPDIGEAAFGKAGRLVHHIYNFVRGVVCSMC